jgi:hypothetical protein
MVRALPDSDDAVPVALAEAALTLYAAVARGSGGRDDALPLLAADALLTHAFEAQAEADPEGVAELADRYGASGRLGILAEVQAEELAS